jgi:hypothetical protein
LSNFKLPQSAAEQPKREIKNVSIALIDNPFFDKPFITVFEALDTINYLSGKLKEIERKLPIDNGRS